MNTSSRFNNTYDQNTRIQHPTERQMENKLYLEEYNIESIITEMINCLIHEKDKSPIVFMIKYLAGLLTEEERKKYNLSIPEPYPLNHPIVEYPEYNKNCNSLLKEKLTCEIFSKIKSNYTKNGCNFKTITLLNEICPKNNIGCFIADKECLEKFEELYKPIICKVHNLDIDEMKNYVKSNCNLQSFSLNDIKDIDISQIKGLSKISFCISRNITDSPFITISCGEDRISRAVNLLVKEFDNNLANKYGLQKIEYVEKNKINETLDYVRYDKEFFKGIIPNQNIFLGKRFLYQNGDKSLVMLINFANNLEVIRTFGIKDNNKFKNEDLFDEFKSFVDMIRDIDYVFGFDFSHSYGYLTSDIKLLGKGFKITSEIIDEEDDGNSNFKEIGKIKEKIDKYSENVYIDNNDDEEMLVYNSSIKISQESISKFLIEYFKKMKDFFKNKK